MGANKLTNNIQAVLQGKSMLFVDKTKGLTQDIILQSWKDNFFEIVLKGLQSVDPIIIICHSHIFLFFNDCRISMPQVSIIVIFGKVLIILISFQLSLLMMQMKFCNKF